MRNVRPPSSIVTDCRSRWFFGLSDVQTRQWQPMTGTPVEVPVPRNVTIMVLEERPALLKSYLREREFSGGGVDHHRLARFVPGRQDRDCGVAGGDDALLMEVAEDDVRISLL